MTEPVWTLGTAINFAVGLDAYVRQHGYSVGITGDVMRTGSSQKDLDIVLYPLSSDKHDVFALRSRLVEYGLSCKRDTEMMHHMWAKYLSSSDKKYVEEWKTADGKRVDLFFLS